MCENLLSIKFFSILLCFVLLRERPFCMALVEHLGDGSWYSVCGSVQCMWQCIIIWYSVCTGCCNMALVFAIRHLYIFIYILLFCQFLYYHYLSDGMVNDTSMSQPSVLYFLTRVILNRLSLKKKMGLMSVYTMFCCIYGLILEIGLEKGFTYEMTFEMCICRV